MAGLKKKLRWLIPFPKRKTIERWFPNFEIRNLVYLMQHHNITTTLDVGANIGQYGEKLRSAGYKGKIISFEPTKDAFAELSKKAANDENWIIHNRCAVGATSGKLKINVYGDSSLSSAIPLLDNQTSLGEGVLNPSQAGASLQHVETCEMIAIDDIFEQYIKNDERVLLKIDVQGFEKEVLLGAAKSLDKIYGLQIEVSLAPMYEDDVHYLDMLGQLKDMGFHLVFTLPVTSRARLGELVQIDALLFRKPIAGQWNS